MFGCIWLGRFVNEGTGLELVHRTEVEDVPTAICPFGGRVIVGIGKLLRIYDLGKKKLLRKCENKVSVIKVKSLLCLFIFYRHLLK